MAKQNVNYQNTKMYKIVCKNLAITDCYAGHTTEFRRRKSQHKHSCNTPEDKKYNYPVYKFIRENGGWDNWQIIEIEKFPCNDANEARARERYHYEKLNANLNGNVPNRSNKEYNDKWRSDNIERVQEYKKNYRIIHKDDIQMKQSAKSICEICNKEYSHANKARHEKTAYHKDNI